MQVSRNPQDDGLSNLKLYFRDSQQQGAFKLAQLIGGGRCGARIGASRCIIWWTKLMELEEADAEFASIGASKRQFERVGASLIANK